MHEEMGGRVFYRATARKFGPMLNIELPDPRLFYCGLFGRCMVIRIGHLVPGKFVWYKG